MNDARVVDDGRSRRRRDGELELRNPAIMRGYYEMPEETAAVIVDGWLRTGDLVTDDGHETYTFLGRKKEVIRRVRRGRRAAAGHKAPIIQTAQSRIAERMNWRTIAYFLENTVFLLIGLQAQWILARRRAAARSAYAGEIPSKEYTVG